MKHRLFYLCGQIGLMLQLRFFFQWILDFSTRETNGAVLFSGVLVGILLFGFRIFDAVTDPLAGTLSDFFVKRGKSRSYLMKLFAPLISLGLIVSFLPRSGFSPLANWISLSTGFFLFFSGYTLYCIPFWSMVDDLSGNNLRKREAMSFSLGLGIFIATALGFVVTPFLISELGYFTSSCLLGIVTLPLLYLPTFLEDKSEINENFHPEAYSFSTELKNIFSPFLNLQFLHAVVLLVLVQFSFTALTSVAPVFVEVVLGQKREFLAFIMGPVILFAILTFLFLSKLLSSTSLENILARSVFYQGLLFILVLPVYFISTQSNYGFQILFAFFGIPIAIVLGIEALVVIRHAQSTGHIGVYFGAFNFAVKAFNGISIMITGKIIDLARESGGRVVIPIFFAGLGVLMIVVPRFLTGRNNE